MDTYVVVLCSGVVSAISWSIGTIVSGPIVSRMKITISRLLLFVVVIHAISIGGYTISLFLDCPEAEWSGTHGPDIGYGFL
jgi:Organic Anion Transporter Polypeptide (OATP) family